MQTGAIIHQFYDKGLSHSSYAILSGNQVALIDPARDTAPYREFARQHGALITTVIETHPHADFVSSHLEFSQNGATIYASALTQAAYPHVTFDEGDELKLGHVVLKALNTPGHSPDSICILLEEQGGVTAVFSGDTLFAGDVGRPDLRENTPGASAKKEELAHAMYRSTREKLMTLPPETRVYPSHGPGSLCGKHLSPDLWSTIGTELRKNYALQPMTADEFVSLITSEQPFIPAYFGFDVALNKQGADPLGESLSRVPAVSLREIDPNILLVDTREAGQFRQGHAPNSINIPDGNSFETWLGTVVKPGEPFYLLSDSPEQAAATLAKTAKIGYETAVKAQVLSRKPGDLTADTLDLNAFRNHRERYTIVDIRNLAEIKTKKVFHEAIELPLPDLRQNLDDIPLERPVIVHCAGGYRSAIGSSIISRSLPGLKVYDLGNAIELFK